MVRKSVGSYSLEGSSPSSRIANVSLHYVGVFKLSFVILRSTFSLLNEEITGNVVRYNPFARMVKW